MKEQKGNVYLKANSVPPKLTGIDYFKSDKHRQAYAKLLFKIWSNLEQRLQKPITVCDFKRSRRVDVLGLTRYLVHKTEHVVNCKLKQGTFNENGWLFSFQQIEHFKVDPPLICNKRFISYFIGQWATEIDLLADRYVSECEHAKNIEALECVEVILKQYTKAIYKAVRLSTNWAKLRQDVFKAMQLDDEVVQLSRLSRVSLKKHSLSELHFNHVCKNLDAYRQIYQDAPNLMWVYRLAKSEGLLKSNSDNPVADLKAVFLKHNGTQRGWRILAKSKQKSFDHIIDGWNRWHSLIEYLGLHDRLDLTKPISHRVSYLFAEPHWQIAFNNQILTYRGIELQPNFFKKLLNAYIDNQKSGNLKVFEEFEASKVLTWISNNHLTFDANQQKKPWSWFVEKADKWIREEIACDDLKSISWACNLREDEYSGYRFTPITNAWELRLEAIRQHHCADTYIDSCINGLIQMIHVQDLKNHNVYTLSLSHYNLWEISELKGFANKNAPDSLWQACHEIVTNINRQESEIDEVKSETIKVPVFGLGNGDHAIAIIDELISIESSNDVDYKLNQTTYYLTG